MTGPAAAAPARPPVVLDTGFLLSVAVDDEVTRHLKNRWEGRNQEVLVPKEVSEELTRASQPGYGGNIPRGLVGSAVKKTTFLGTVVRLDDAELVAFQELHERLASQEDSGKHVGEAAVAAVARCRHGVALLEDNAARRVLQETVTCMGLRELLYSLLNDGFLTDADVDGFIGRLVQNGRPNFHGVTAAEIRASPLQTL